MKLYSRFSPFSQLWEQLSWRQDSLPRVPLMAHMCHLSLPIHLSSSAKHNRATSWKPPTLSSTFTTAVLKYGNTEIFLNRNRLGHQEKALSCSFTGLLTCYQNTIHILEPSSSQLIPLQIEPPLPHLHLFLLHSGHVTLGHVGFLLDNSMVLAKGGQGSRAHPHQEPGSR